MSKVLGYLGGFTAGVVLSGLGGSKLMQTKMAISIKSPKSFEDTCQSIEKTVAEFADEDWGFPIEKWNFYQVFEKNNLVPERIKNIMVYFICNAKLANTVINANNSMMGIMPCSWAVYENENGVFIAKMNIGLMSKMFTGTIKDMMLKVEDTEKRMIEKIFE
jgi:uncharacterized protein (DUF302 family)